MLPRALAIITLLLLVISKWTRLQFLLDQAPGLTESHAHAVGSFKWFKCEGAEDVPGAECGYIIVPLDYLNASAGVAKVALGRYKATSEPRLGMVLFNPGGPGGAGKPVATRRGPNFQSLIGKEYDFVGFDPRGIGETEPRVNCFGSTRDHQLFKGNTVLERGFDVAPNLTDPLTRDHLIKQQQEAESLYKTQFELCGDIMGDSLKYMGTSTVSRDIDFITTTLEGKNALINYFGGSYGSILGQYLVNMFPNRVGRVVIDGIADAVAWSSAPSYTWYRQCLGYTESTYQLFLEGCSKAGPKVCALAQNKHEEPSAIEARIETFFAGLYSKPLAIPHATRPTILTPGRARVALLWTLLIPRSWPTTALALSQAMQGNGTSLLNIVLSVTESARDLGRSAVSCNDNAPSSGPSPEEVIDEALDVLKTVTRFGLSVVTSEPDAGCQFWPVTPPERFQGPWNHTLNNPILILSNTADPVTPISSARLVNERLGNSSRLAIREGPGHGSTSLASLCTTKIMQAYFKDGTLPPNEQICPAEETPFPDPDNDHELTEEDAAMLEHLKIVGDAMYRARRGLPW